MKLPQPVLRHARPIRPAGDVDPFALGPLVDRFGRVHKDLRISLTDRCSLRCTYCMPAEGMPWMPRAQLLTFEEIWLITSVALRLGIDEVRLTGGEPLIRADVVHLVEGIKKLRTLAGKPPEVSMTTNGLLLGKLAKPLKDAGLDRVNISLDTLRRDRYLALTRRDKLGLALEGIAAARAVGFQPLKLNAVAMRGVNDDELAELVAFAISHDAQLRFIEHMPLDAGHTWTRSKMLTANEILAALGQHYTLTELPGRGAAPAALYSIDGGPHTVGVIGSVTRPFCAACDRVRLTADGQLRNCLFATSEQDLRDIVRDEELDDHAKQTAVAFVLRASIGAKKAGHGIGNPDFVQPARSMSAIGG